GKGQKTSRNEWLAMIRQLVAAGYLKLDIAGYGALAITAKGRAFSAGCGRFFYREDATVSQTRKRRGSTGRREKHINSATMLSTSETLLLAALKELRLELARERSIPPYVVFHDRSLEDMARRQPRCRQDFAAVHGVGRSKLEKFAEPFLAVITEHLPKQPG
ncbi:MAG: HRDC domain-containing protein, partial [Kiloniellales bacterium]|nr:HRDC domain-containing protein [Kiloniellales bacterium]